jgi:hypothetical protein
MDASLNCGKGLMWKKKVEKSSATGANSSNDHVSSRSGLNCSALLNNSNTAGKASLKF